MGIRGRAYGVLYRRLPTPRVSVVGLTASAEPLFNGEMIGAVADWWNRFLDKRPELERAGSLQRFTPAEGSELAASVNPENQPLIEGMGAEHAPTAPRLGGAALALAYAFARTLYAGNPGWTDKDRFRIWSRRLYPIKVETLEHYGKRYTQFADYEMWEESPGWWIEREQEWVVHGIVIRGMRWAYADQVSRWEKSEGRALGKGIGWSIEEGELLTDFRDRIFELGGRLLEAEVETIT